MIATVPFLSEKLKKTYLKNTTTVFRVYGIKPNILESLINVAYGCQQEINCMNVKPLLIGSKFLQMSQLSKACANFLLKKMCTGNVLKLRNFSLLHGLEELKNCTDECLQRHFCQIYLSKRFMQLQVSDIEEILSKKLCVRNEGQVFEAMIMWVKFSPAHRSFHLPKLLKATKDSQIAVMELTLFISKRA